MLHLISALLCLKEFSEMIPKNPHLQAYVLPCFQAAIYIESIIWCRLCNALSGISSKTIQRLKCHSSHFEQKTVSQQSQLLMTSWKTLMWIGCTNITVSKYTADPLLIHVTQKYILKININIDFWDDTLRNSNLVNKYLINVTFIGPGNAQNAFQR